MTLVILAAGMGSRYGGLKQIDPITKDGNFSIDFSIFDAVREGFDKIVFVIKRENYEIFKETVGSRIEPHVKVEYVFQDMDDLPAPFTRPEGRVKPWGTGHAILAARHVVKDNFAIINSDDFYGRDAFRNLAGHLRTAKDDGGAECCMIGYVLKNTMTENGSVSRGECYADDKGYLTNVIERTKIYKDAEGKGVYEDKDGLHGISLDTIVSMNCIGFTPSVFAEIEKGFVEFLKSEKDELKAEYYCPTAVFNMIKGGKATFKLIKTDACWCGVTYHEDKPAVMATIRALIDAGEYPEKLWN